MSATEKTVFQRIIDREIPAKIVHEDERCLVFEDINPCAPVHLIVIPKKPVPSLAELSDDDAALAGHLLVVMRRLGEKLGLSGGYRVVANCGRDAGQEVMHLHFHFLAGRPFSWPPG